METSTYQELTVAAIDVDVGADVNAYADVDDGVALVLRRAHLTVVIQAMRQSFRDWTIEIVAVVVHLRTLRLTLALNCCVL